MRGIFAMRLSLFLRPYVAALLFILRCLLINNGIMTLLYQYRNL
jgi:hypothetical protein